MKKGREANLKPFKLGDDPRRNISGRPKKLPEIDYLLFEVLGQGDKAKLILEALAKRAMFKGGDRAAEILLDRGWGKPPQTIRTDSDMTITVKHES